MKKLCWCITLTLETPDKKFLRQQQFHYDETSVVSHLAKYLDLQLLISTGWSSVGI
jgi:hypothetical protein